VGLIKLTEEEKKSGPDPDDEKKYKELIAQKEEEYKKIEERDSVANLEHFKNINISKDSNVDEDFVQDEEDEEETEEQEPIKRFSSLPAIHSPTAPLPEFDAPRRGRPLKTARNDDMFNMLLNINASLNDLSRRLSSVESNQKKMAELQVKAVCDYAHQDHEQLIQRIKKLLERPAGDSPQWIDHLRNDLDQSFSESNQRLDSFQERIELVINGINETKQEVEEFSRICSALQTTPVEKKKTSPVPSDLRTLCMRAFQSIIAPISPPDQDDYARIERIFDLALQKSNTNNDKATELFVYWIHQFYSHILDHEETERTVYEFFRFVAALTKTT
jgi:hypothetical protein